MRGWEGDRAGRGPGRGVVFGGRRGLGARSAAGGGAGLGGPGLGQVRRGGVTRPVLTEPEPVEEGPTVHSGAGEGGGVAEGRSQGKKGGGSGRLGMSLRGSPPPSRGLQTRPLPVALLVGRSVGRWVSDLQLGSQLSCSEVGRTRERPAHLSRPERSPAPRSVGSLHAPRPAADPAGALPGTRRAPRS